MKVCKWRRVHTLNELYIDKIFLKCPLTLGVPQGSILDPPLISIHVLPLWVNLSNHKIHYHCYVDDIHLYLPQKPTNYDMSSLMSFLVVKKKKSSFWIFITPKQKLSSSLFLHLNNTNGFVSGLDQLLKKISGWFVFGCCYTFFPFVDSSIMANSPDADAWKQAQNTISPPCFTEYVLMLECSVLLSPKA